MEQTLVSPQIAPDEMLINKILAGEKKLFEILIRRYNQRLFRIGMSILEDDMETEDAMQNTYVSAYEHLVKFENRAAFSTWLTRIMMNECLAQKKKKQRIQVGAMQEYENYTTMVTPANVLANKELNAMLEGAVAQLPEKYRLVFMLREVEDLSVKETSEVLNIEESNVKVRLNRAKTMLRESLNGYVKDNVYAFHLTRCDRIVANVFTRLQIA